MTGVSAEARKKQARNFKAPSGKTKETIPVHFREYIFPKQEKSDPDLAFTFKMRDYKADNLRPFSPPEGRGWTVNIGGDDMGSPSLGKAVWFEYDLETPSRRWIYIFEDKGSSSYLLMELNPVDNDGAELVDWGVRNGQGGHKRWSKEKKRPCSVTEKEIRIEKGKKYFALVSQIQLPYERIEELEKDCQMMKKRGTPFETKDGDNAKLVDEVNKDKLEVYLIDPLRIAHYLQNQYLCVHEEFLKYAADPKRATRANIGQMAYQIGEYLVNNKKSAWDWIDKGKLLQEISDIDKSSESLFKERAFACKRRNAWYNGDMYNEVRNDFDYVEEDYLKLLAVESFLLGGSLESEEGQLYLHDIFTKNPWFDRWVKNPYGLGRRGVQLTSEACKKGVDWNLAILKQAAFEKIKNLSLQEAERQVAYTIKKMGIVEEVVWRDIRGQMGKVDLKQAGVSSLGEYYEAQRINVDKSLQRQVEKTKDAGQRTAANINNVMLVLNFINMLFASATYFQSRKKQPTDEQKWKERRALVGFVKDSASFITSFEKAPMAESFRSNIGRKIGQARLQIIFRGLSIVAAVADYIGGLIDIYRGHKKGRGALVATGSLTALAGVAAFAAVAAKIAGAAVLGISATWWTVISVVILVIVIIITWLFFEEPLESWLRDTPWGKDTKLDWMAGGRKRPSLDKLHQNLFKILSQYYVEREQGRGLRGDLVRYMTQEEERMCKAFDIFVKFGYLPTTAIVDIKFTASVKNLEGKEVRQSTRVHIMPYLKSYAVIEGEADLQFEEKTWLPFFVGMRKTTSEEKECNYLYMNLASKQVYSMYQKLYNDLKSKNMSVNRLYSELDDRYDWSYTVRIDLFADGTQKIPYKGPVVAKKGNVSQGRLKVDSNDVDD